MTWDILNPPRVEIKSKLPPEDEKRVQRFIKRKLSREQYKKLSQLGIEAQRKNGKVKSPRSV